jgi:Glyoxalase-like domain
MMGAGGRPRAPRARGGRVRAAADRLEPTVELDHVLIAVADLAAAARELDARFGLASVDGGRHPGWGTANRIVPLGDSYLELVSVVDTAEAAVAPFGKWVAARGARPLGWAVRVPDIDAVARRLHLTVAAGSRATRSGEILRWRMAGLEHAAAEPSLPFFIEWAPGAPFPGRAPCRHRAGDVRVVRLDLEGDGDRVATWLGGEDLPIAVGRGTAAVAGIVLEGRRGEIVLDQL